MSLRDAYFTGPSGLHQQMDAAFAAGEAYVGAGANDITTLDLGDRNGSNLSAGAGMPGLYFTYSSPTAVYAMWMLENGEIAPTISNAQLFPVAILSSDSSTQVAVKIAAAMNAISGEPFAAVSNANVVTMQNDVAGVVLLPASAGTLGGTAVIAQVQPGVAPTGNYATLQTALNMAAARGQLDFRVLIQGTGTGNAMYLRAQNGNNLYLRSFFAGIQYAMANEGLYDYQVSPELDISMHSSTNVIFRFNFGCSNLNKPAVRLEPLKGCNNPDFPI